MIKCLYDRGLVSYEPYHGVHLTERGKGIAVAASQRRRLLKRYLTEKLGYGAEGAHIEAIGLERAVSGALEIHIEAALNALLAVNSGAPRLTAVVGPVDGPFATNANHLA